MSLDICVPVYNEGENIIPLLNALKEKVNLEFRLLVIYDMEEDNTLPVLQPVMEQYPFPIHLIRNQYGRGVANAIRTGMDHVQEEYWLVTMADLSDEPATIPLMYQKMQELPVYFKAGS